MKHTAPTRLVVRAPAKINLTLCVGRRRSDNFHEIESFFQAIDLCDLVELENASANGEVLVTTSDPALPCDARNTAFRAAQLLIEAWAPGRSVRIHLEKRIPSQAGLGGGSSDAAAVLRGLNRLWGLDLPPQALLSMAAAVGSDVPFFLTGGCAVVRGRGEVVQPFTPPFSGWVVLVKPDFGVSTAQAYAHLAAQRAGITPPHGEVMARMARALSRGDVCAVARALHNDLEQPVFRAHPQLAALKDELEVAGALGALLSGSGSTVFGLFSSEAAARRAAEELAGRWPWVAAVPTREADDE
ncbi:MAG: 4-(cytidine 5'-diphospho)-2-C-methyl-D-erythritol kinase [Armatimonadota bacterium]|nr:4-(cytidine 5'-diphospho)-2-C-methyl-D-erythritol kinase [Armatimonadota bacterium]